MSYDHRALAERALKVIAAQPSVTLRALSQSTGVSRHTLSCAIRAATGRHFRRLIADVKLSRLASGVRRREDASIKSLAVDLGYNSASSLSRFVRSHVGMTSTQLRTSARSGPPLDSHPPAEPQASASIAQEDHGGTARR